MKIKHAEWVVGGVVAALALIVSPTRGAVIATASPTQPTAGPYDQYTFDQSGTLNGSLDFGDDGHSSSGGPAGVPGQSFTVPTGTSPYTLNSVSLKVNIAASGGYATYFNGGGVLGIEIAKFDNTASGGYAGRTDSNGNAYSASYLASSFTKVAYTAVSSPTYDTSAGDPWITFTFSDADLLTLVPGGTYSFDFFNGNPTAGGSTYLGFYRSGGDTYAGGVGYNSYSASRNFNDTYVISTGADRTFDVSLSPAVVPEASSLSLVGLGGLALVRHRRT